MDVDHYSDYSSEGEYWEEGPTAPDSILLSLVQSYDWNGAFSRIINFPEECKAIGVQGRTPLHVACDHDAPAAVIQALMKAYPEASLEVGTSNMNPLHITCSSHHASPQVVQVLLETSGLGRQMSSMRDVDGDTPLHAACRCGAPMEVLQLLLQAHPSAVNERDYEGLTPLHRLWVRYFVILGDGVIRGVKGPGDITGELGEAWKKTELLLRCAYLGSLQMMKKDTIFHPMHAMAAVDLPRPVVKIATIIYRDRLLQRDENGMTPLLIAAMAPVYQVRDLSDDGYMLEDRIHGDGDTYEEMAYEEDVDNSQPSVIDIIMEAAPAAATMPDPSGRLALHLAISAGKRWHQGVRAILDGYPEALTQEDSANGLVPFWQASVVLRPDCGTIFELLRRDPALILHCTDSRIENGALVDADGDAQM